MKFDFWIRWGVNLSDADFAAAWLALGIAAGAARKPPAAKGDLARARAAPATPDDGLAIARDALTGVQAGSLGNRVRSSASIRSLSSSLRFFMRRMTRSSPQGCAAMRAMASCRS